MGLCRNPMIRLLNNHTHLTKSSRNLDEKYWISCVVNQEGYTDYLFFQMHSLDTDKSSLILFYYFSKISLHGEDVFYLSVHSILFGDKSRTHNPN